MSVKESTSQEFAQSPSTRLSLATGCSIASSLWRKWWGASPEDSATAIRARTGSSQRCPDCSPRAGRSTLVSNCRPCWHVAGILVLAVSILAATSTAQVPEPVDAAPGLINEAESNLVLVPLRVSRERAAMIGLGPAYFEVFEDGNPRKSPLWSA